MRPDSRAITFRSRTERLLRNHRLSAHQSRADSRVTRICVSGTPVRPSAKAIERGPDGIPPVVSRHRGRANPQEIRTALFRLIGFRSGPSSIGRNSPGEHRPTRLRCGEIQYSLCIHLTGRASQCAHLVTAFLRALHSPRTWRRQHTEGRWSGGIALRDVPGLPLHLGQSGSGCQRKRAHPLCHR